MKTGAIYCFVFLFIFNCAYAQNIDAYIAAPSGLNLRKTPSAKGVVIKKLPFATKLSIIKTTEAKVPYKSKEAEGFYLTGNFIKVLAGKDTGYVFDAFLLPFQPFDYADFENIYNESVDDCKPYECHLLERAFGKGGKLFGIEKLTGEDTVFISDKNSPYCVKSFKQDFDGGKVVFENQYYPEVGGGSTTVFIGYPLNLVYAMVLSYTNPDNEKLKITYTNKVIEIGPIDGGAGCYSTITVKGNVITWEYGCGC